MAKKVKKKPVKKKPATGKGEALFVKSKIREYIKSKGCNTSSGVLDGNTLNKIIENALDKAIARAKSNKRKTVQEKDL